ncbi:hypothetical protein [Streptomyces griseorubiginosus]|uniref:hypothetical protein n=1 Tax=Streptomyces griseorubiginosus TaxID=67304 RepID=UPI0036637E03
MPATSSSSPLDDHTPSVRPEQISVTPRSAPRSIELRIRPFTVHDVLGKPQLTVPVHDPEGDTQH